jgi:Putative transmembrane protein (PGPGW)
LNIAGLRTDGASAIVKAEEGLAETMALTTVEQVRRVFRIVAGFTLLAAGAVMLVTPGPGWLVIFLGLGLLAAEFVWAKRLMDRMKREGGRIKDSVLGNAEGEKRREPDPVVADAPKPGEQGSADL